MRYLELYTALKDRVHFDADTIQLADGLVLRNFDFQSRPRFHLTEEEREEDHAIPAAMDQEDEMHGIHTGINKKDADIEENFRFRYHLMLPEGADKARNVVIMFHGLNEKYWHKYLPWAARIVADTGRAVLMFPIAFHMNRTPALWYEPRAMNRVSKQRREQYPNVIGSSLSNVAISTRLHNKPERFLWSGLQSYHDVIDLVEAVKKGGHPAIAPDAELDFCSYSIGTFLGEIIMMTNHNGWFSDSRYATFCGGPVFNRLSPVSKFILDSEANVRLYSYLVEHLESHIKEDETLHHFLSGAYEEGVNFRSLLSYRMNRNYREDKLRALQRQFYAVALAQDEVVPPYEVTNTLRGSRQDIDIKVDVLDFPYPYRHEDPFPANAKIADAVDEQFRNVFNRITAFLR